METFTDPRDGNVYKIVKIGNLYWFAENLRYQGVPYHFPNRDSGNVPQYGCLYTWDNAMKAYPEGWKLPTREEFDDLLKITTYTKNYSISDSLRSIGWSKGSDKLGFGALPAGSRYYGYYLSFGNYGYWWSSTERNSSYAYYLYLGNGDANVDYGEKTSGCSVRCVREA